MDERFDFREVGFFPDRKGGFFLGFCVVDLGKSFSLVDLDLKRVDLGTGFEILAETFGFFWRCVLEEEEEEQEEEEEFEEMRKGRQPLEASMDMEEEVETLLLLLLNLGITFRSCKGLLFS